MANIYLVRHGQASFGSENYDQLSELGKRQCVLLGEWMKQTQQPVDKIIVGAMHRQRQSAEAFLQGYGAPAHLLESEWQSEVGLNEFDHIQVLRVARPEFFNAAQLTQFLATQEQPRQVFETMFEQALARWMSGTFDSEYAESWSGFQERINKVLQILASDHVASADQHVIVFTSAGPIGVTCQKLLGIPDTHLMQFLSTMLNSGVTRLRRKRGQISLSTINGVAHLEQHADQDLISFR